MCAGLSAFGHAAARGASAFTSYFATVGSGWHMTLIALLLIATRLLALALASGVNLYATIAVLGLAIRFDWIEPLPPALIGLEQWLLIGGALALFVVELVASAIPRVDTIWETFHTAVRPLAAWSLAFVALEAAPWPLRLLGATLAGTAAFAAHVTKFGLRLLRTRQKPDHLRLSVAEDAMAIALATLALLHPMLGLVLVALTAASLSRIGPGPWRAAVFAARAALAWVRGFFGGRGWQPVSALPQPFQHLVSPQEVGLPAPRLARAALSTAGAGTHRNGWIVFDRNAAAFLYRHAFRPRRLALTRPDEAAIRHDWLADVVDLRVRDSHYTLHLLKDGPPAEITVGALQLVIE